VLAGAVGNLIDRATVGYVTDFIDVYWRDWHFWAFNVADSAITIGAGLVILDLLVTDDMHPVLFEIALPVHTYGVLLAAAYLLGLQLAVMRAKRFGLEPRASWTWDRHHHRGLLGAKALLFVVDFRKFVSDRASS